MDEAFWKDERKIEDMSFGAELTPKLVDVMKEHPWPENAFTYMPPVFTYVPAPNGPLGFDVDADRAEKQAAFDAWASVPANIEAHRAAQFADWKKRMAELPTSEARDAWQTVHAGQIARVRMLLRSCDVKTADDIKKLGCTGAAYYGLSLDDIKFLRMGLAGGGVGLPCFVPPTRYCFAHETTGGLQEGQTPGYANIVESISRELTPEEIAHGKLVTEAQWSETQRGAFEKLRGRKLPEGWEENVEALRKEGGIDDIVAAARAQDKDGMFGTIRAERVDGIVAAGKVHVFPAIQRIDNLWQCPEHKKTNWQCRYCVAQAVVEGDIEPVFVVDIPESSTHVDMTPAELLQKLDACNQSGFSAASVYVRVATFTRKLSRD